MWEILDELETLSTHATLAFVLVAQGGGIVLFILENIRNHTMVASLLKLSGPQEAK